MPLHPELLTPLSPGNVVNVSIQLYRARFKEYIGVAVTTVLWIAALLLLFVPVTFATYAFLPQTIATLLIFPLGLVLSFYGFGRYLAGSAAISRLVFKELMAEPEIAQDAKRFTHSRTWSYGLMGVVLFFIFAGVFLGMYFALVLLVVVILAGSGGLEALGRSPAALSQFVNDPASAIAFLLGFMVVLLLFAVVWTWVYARFAIAEIPHGVEPEVTATGSIGRSWALTEKQTWHSALILFTMPFVLLPFNILFQFGSSMMQSLIIVLVSTNNSVGIAIAYLVSFILGLLSFVVLLPITQAIKGVLYYDLRNRREGITLKLRAADVDAETIAVQPTDKTSAAPLNLFKKVTLQTPESVELEFTLAGLGNRVLALLIDDLFVILGIALFWFFGILFATQLLTNLSSSSSGADVAIAGLWLLAIAILGTFVIGAGYFVIFETLRQGQTPGKRFANIRVIRDDGRPVGLVQSLLRALLRPIDDIFFVVGPTLILFDQNEKRLGDLVAGTLVIQERRETKKQGAIALSADAPALAKQLTTLSDLSLFLPDDFAVVREFLQRRDQMIPHIRSTLSMDLARQARTLIKLETLPPNITSDQFLEALYLAYQK